MASLTPLDRVRPLPTRSLMHHVTLEIAEAAVPQVEHLPEIRVGNRIGQPQFERDLRVAVLVDHRLGEGLVLVPLVDLLEGGLNLGGEAGPDLDLVALDLPFAAAEHDIELRARSRAFDHGAS